MLEVMIGLLGVVVGWALGLIERSVSEAKEERLLGARVRTLLSIEVGHNLCLLKSLQGELRGYGGEVVESEPADPQRYNRSAWHFSNAALPAWADEIWRSQLPLVGRTLDAGEIEAVVSLYQGISRIRAIHLTLNDLQSKDTSSRIAGGVGVARSIIGPSRFAGGASELWPELVHLVDRLVADGNPIAAGAACPSRLRRQEGGHHVEAQKRADNPDL